MMGTSNHAFKWLKNLLSFKGSPMRYPLHGEQWRLKSDTLLPKKDDNSVFILEVKDGWVYYDMKGLVFSVERLRIDSFLHCYRFHGPADL